MELQDRVTQLIAICRENAESFRRAAEILVDEPEFAHYFEETSENRLLAADSLENKLLQNGRRLNTEILASPPREGWTRPTGNETNLVSVIEACHEAEERAVAAFEEAAQLLPEEWRWALNEYSQHMRSALAKMHAWLAGKEVGEARERGAARAASNRLKSPRS